MVDIDSIRQRWYSGESIPDVIFGPNDGVVASPGNVMEDVASVISLESVHPKFMYLIEGADGSDKTIEQSELALLIYVAMIDEGTCVWRPVAAKPAGEGIARILTTCPEDETWEFPAGALVNYEEQDLEGHGCLVAKRGAGDAA